MYVIEYDPERVLAVHVHHDGPLSHGDVDAMVAAIERSAADGKRARKKVSTLLVVHSPHGPDAKQRHRIGTAAATIEEGYDVMVSTSTVTRALMTAIRWLTRREKMKGATVGTYEEGRDWLAAESGHPAEAIDALYRRCMARVDRDRPSSRP